MVYCPSFPLRDVILTSSSGSGKTLAYLSPLVSRLRDEEEHLGLVPRVRRPRALVLLPSRDLAAQVLVSGETIWKPYFWFLLEQLMP